MKRLFLLLLLACTLVALQAQTPTPAAQVPAWMAGVVANMQKISDGQCADKKAGFAVAAQNWLTNAAIDRDAGRAVTPFAVPIPQCDRWYAAGDPPTYAIAPDPPDPNLHAPVLPPPHVGPVSPIATTAPAADAAHDAIEAQILTILLDVQKKLAALSAKFGVQ